MVMTAREILEKDIQKLYLGNLNTVEFDLKLPVGEQMVQKSHGIQIMSCFYDLMEV